MKLPKDFQTDKEFLKKNTSKFKLFSPKILALIIGLAIVYQVYISTYDDTPALDFAEFSYIISSSTCGIIAITVGIKYKFHETFRTSYIGLGISFLLLCFGEITYLIYYYVLKTDAFPSMADVFFLSAGIFAFIHLTMNINYFKTKISKKTKIFLPVLGGTILLMFSIVSFNQIGEVNLDFVVGMLYANNYSILIPLAILGIIVARKTIFGSTWLLLVIGILSLGIGKVWWIYLEYFEGFSYSHPVNTVWLFGYMIIAFALIEHIRLDQRKNETIL